MPRTHYLPDERVHFVWDTGNEPVLGWAKETSGSKVRAWAAGLDVPIGGETILFADCEAAFKRPSVPRAVALILRAAGVEFGLMNQQWCCGGPMWETGYVDIALKMAEHNMLDWRKTGSRRIVCLDPHDYITIIENYPKLDPNFDEFEIVLAVDLIAEQLREDRLELTTPIERTVTYHDPCRLNKRLGVWKSPREILRAIPGLTFIDVDHVTQWSYCSGAGSNLFVEKPELTAEIKRMYVRPRFRGRGFAKLVLYHLSDYAWAQGVSLLRLETGIHQHEAIGLYERVGFQRIPPFGDYKVDPLSVFYEKSLTPR